MKRYVKAPDILGTQCKGLSLPHLANLSFNTVKQRVACKESRVGNFEAFTSYVTLVRALPLSRPSLSEDGVRICEHEE